MKKSAGILLYKYQNQELEIFLVHPGGPFWKNKDLGSWSIPKGEFTDEEIPLDAAISEFEEETGTKLAGNFLELQPIKLSSGKLVYCWALAGDLNANQIKSNTFEMEWPPKSGKTKSFPEVDKGGWFLVSDALQKINTAQSAFINELQSILKRK